MSHFFPVPIATYNEKTWRRWIFEMCRRVENHELGEWFRVGGVRPFAPLHGPGEDPYTVHEYRSELDAQTTQDGTVHADKIKTVAGDAPSPAKEHKSHCATLNPEWRGGPGPCDCNAPSPAKEQG